MGRGLSELQKRILMLVYEGRQGRDFEDEKRRLEEIKKDPMYWALHGDEGDRPYRTSDYPDATNPKLIGTLYDWPIHARFGGERLRTSEGGQVHSSLQNFRRGKRRGGVDEAEYNRRTTSYYRAVGRLKRRGLLRAQRHGLSITDEGMRVAEGYRLEESAVVEVV
jgi:hypothetical protein